MLDYILHRLLQILLESKSLLVKLCTLESTKKHFLHTSKLIIQSFLCAQLPLTSLCKSKLCFLHSTSKLSSSSPFHTSTGQSSLGHLSIEWRSFGPQAKSSGKVSSSLLMCCRIPSKLCSKNAPQSPFHCSKLQVHPILCFWWKAR